jgi:lipase ATG15
MRHVLLHDRESTGNPLHIYDVYHQNVVYMGKDGEDGTISLRLGQRPAQIYRLPTSESTLLNNTPAEFRNATQEGDDSTQEWRLTHVSEPDVSDKETVLSLAKMASDAYLLDEHAPDWLWLNSSAGFNLSSGFGWQDNRLRGHVFANAENRTIVIAIKGTSAGKPPDRVCLRPVIHLDTR